MTATTGKAVYGPRPGRRAEIQRDIRRVVAALRSQRRRPRFGYIGWLGQDNLGDEALFVAHQRALGDGRVFEMPHGWSADLASRLGPGRMMDGLLLGGGTLIGHPGFRRPLQALLDADPRLPAHMLGAGVQDPDFNSEPEAAWAELRAWKPLLARFSEVAVRGPRSQEILDSVGVAARVIGDSALLLGGPTVPDDGPGVLGLNVGVAEKVIGGSVQPSFDALAELGRHGRAQGWTVRLFSVWPSDTPLVRDLAERIGTEEIVLEYTDPDRFIREAGRCRVFAGFKLHAVVLATCSGVPSVMLEYNPKCADFHASLGREALTFRTDTVTGSQLIDAVDGLWADHEAERATLAAAVAPLRDDLRATARRLAESSLGT